MDFGLFINLIKF